MGGPRTQALVGLPWAWMLALAVLSISLGLDMIPQWPDSQASTPESH